MAQFLTSFNDTVGGFVWGPVMLCAVLFTGIYLTAGTKFFQIREFRRWMGETLLSLFRKKPAREKRRGGISPFQALTTALAGTIGVGNIVGVSTAIVAGGPGAIFWMWVSAFFGMMTKYAEIVLGLLFRYRDERGERVGGPMVTIERGLHQKWLAVLFSVFCLLASFGMGNMAQANAIAGAFQSTFSLRPIAVGAVAAAVVGAVIVGGLRSVAALTEKLVPAMSVAYLLGSLAVIVAHIGALPEALLSIFTGAFGPRPLAGGVGGYLLMTTIRTGVSRGVFTNEAGLGSSVMVHAAAETDEPARQGMWGIFEVFLDTIVVCTLTALAVLQTGAHLGGGEGAGIAVAAFSSVFGAFGGVFVSCAVAVFAFATIIGWSYYGECAFRYLFGPRCVMLYRVAAVAMVVAGSALRLDLIWELSDTFNGLMMIPNLSSVLLLSPLVFYETRAFLSRARK